MRRLGIVMGARVSVKATGGVREPPGMGRGIQEVFACPRVRRDGVVTAGVQEVRVPDHNVM